MQFEGFPWLRNQWVVSHHTMFHKYGKRTREFFGGIFICSLA